MKQTTAMAATRRGWAARLLAAVLLWIPGVFVRAEAQAAPAAVVWPEISLSAVVSGLSQPVHVTHAGDGSGRLFIVERAGIVRILSGGSLLATPFLNLSASGANRVRSTGSEEGLLSIAFPPGYPGVGKNHFYVYYTNLAGNNVVARYGLTSANVANPASEQIVLTLNHPNQSNHNGGQLAFGPGDGYLYIGPGDGGGGGDPAENAQNLNSPLGKILRIDVETGSPATYTVPATNPYTQTAGLDEIWALGLRNPWRFSFDRQTHDLYIADVGQGNWEEVNFQPAAGAGGVNYGWDCYESNAVYEATGCGPAGNYTFPVAEYNHSLGCSISGGYVYRGSKYPWMQGIYFYGDYCSGRIWGLKHDGSAWQNSMRLDTDRNISTFGEDEAGNLYLAHLGGTLYEVRASAVYADPAGGCGGNAPCYTSLQAAINAAGTGVAVNATAGVYNESVNLNKSIAVNQLPGVHELTGNLAVSAGAFTATPGTFHVLGNLARSGAGEYRHNNGLTIFEGGTTQAVSGSPAFYDVTIEAGSTVNTGSETLTVLGTLIVNGTLHRDAPAQNVTTGGGPFSFADALNRPAAALTSTGGTSLGSTTVAVTLNQSPADVACGASTISGTPVLRHFEVEPANTSGVAATLRLYYDPATEANGNEPTLLLIYHCDGVSWEALNGNYSIGTDGATGLNYIELPNVTAFSPFAISSPVPTSVRLENFTARLASPPWGGYAAGAAAAAGMAVLARLARRRKGGQ